MQCSDRWSSQVSGVSCGARSRPVYICRAADIAHTNDWQMLHKLCDNLSMLLNCRMVQQSLLPLLPDPFKEWTVSRQFKWFSRMIFIQCMRDIGCVVIFYNAVVAPFPVAYIKAFPFVVCVKCFAHNNVRAAGRFVISKCKETVIKTTWRCAAHRRPLDATSSHTFRFSDNTKGTAQCRPHVVKGSNIWFALSLFPAYKIT